jgi:hypothetical protein
MKQIDNSIRLAIRQIIKEGFGKINESQKGDFLDSQKEKLFSNIKIFSLDGVENEKMIMKEVEKEIDNKINKVLGGTYNYPDFIYSKIREFYFKKQ